MPTGPLTYRMLVVLATACAFLAGCKKPEKEKDIVARVGNRYIGMKELNRSYGLHPQWKRGQTELGSYLTQLDELMTQKLYAQEAEKLGMDRDSLMQGYLRFIKEKEMIKGLYRQEIRGKVQTDTAEVRRLYEWGKKKIDFEYVFAPDSARCASYVRQMATKDANEIASRTDSAVRIGKREGTKVGAVPPDLERLLFSSKLHEVRGPLRMAGGYMGVKITGWTQEKFVSENELNYERQKIEKLAADRHADSLSGAYVYSLMNDKDLKLNAPVFWAVAEYFFRRVKEEHLDQMKMQSVYVTSSEIQVLEDDLRGMNDAIVATHREGSLTVQQLMQSLANMPGSLRPRVRTPANLKAAIGMIVRNQYLLKEAERRRLDRDPEVVYEYNLQRDETLAWAYYGHRRGEVTVTPAEVEAFRKHSSVSEEQVFFKFNMTSLARDAKTDTVLMADLPRLKGQYALSLDTATVRSMMKTPDAVLAEDPIRMYVREIFQ